MTEIIKIERNENKICVESPYNPLLPERAKNLGGKWDRSRKVWVYDIENESYVREMYKEMYGEWPGEAVELVDVRVKLNDDILVNRDSIYFAGRLVARAHGRDSGARLGDGVIVTEKSFTSGGSMKNWCTVGRAGTIFKMREVPRTKVQEEIDKNNGVFEIEILSGIDKEALQAEKAKLLERLAEIEELLEE